MKIYDHELTLKEMDDILAQYPEANDLDFTGFDHNLDPISSKYLYAFMRDFKPNNVIEFGTSWGGSGKVIVDALSKNNQPFKYTGFEIVPEMKQNAEEQIIPIKPDSVKIYDDVMQNLDKIPDGIDFAFIDPNWDVIITKWWLNNLLPKLKDGALVQIHDWSVREVDGQLKYEGGDFAGILYLIEKVNQKVFPFRKIFAVWDYPDYRGKWIACSFWIYEKNKNKNIKYE